jgi:hypothetical protein
MNRKSSSAKEAAIFQRNAGTTHMTPAIYAYI